MSIESIDPNALLIAVIGLIALVIGAVMCIIAASCIKRTKMVRLLYKATSKERDTTLQSTQLKLERETSINKLISSILFDFAHATDPQILRWKMWSIRNIEAFAKSSGRHNDDLYGKIMQCMYINELSEGVSTKEMDATFDSIERMLEDYFIMDIDQKLNTRAVIREIKENQKQYAKALGEKLRADEELCTGVVNADFKLPVVDSRRRHTTPATALLSCADELNGLDFGPDNKDTKEDEQDVAQQAEHERPESSSDADEPAQDIPEPLVQGEEPGEPDSEHAEQVREQPPKTTGGVIVIRDDVKT